MKQINCLDDIISLNPGSLLYDEIYIYYCKQNYKKVIQIIDTWYINLINSLPNDINYNYLSPLMIQNKMTILAYNNEIIERIQLYKDIFFDLIDKINDVKRLKIENCKKKWRNTFYTCECGKVIQNTNRINHNKSVFHTNYLKANKLDKDIIIDINPWFSRVYQCKCGKMVQNAHKYGHEKTKFHTHWNKTINTL
jgi:hypothetical protein